MLIEQSKPHWEAGHWKQLHKKVKQFATVATAVNHLSVKLALAVPYVHDTAAQRQHIVGSTVQQRLSDREAAAVLVMSGPRSAWSRASRSPRCALHVQFCHNRTVLLYQAAGRTRSAAASRSLAEQQKRIPLSH